MITGFAFRVGYVYGVRFHERDSERRRIKCNFIVCLLLRFISWLSVLVRDLENDRGKYFATKGLRSIGFFSLFVMKRRWLNYFLFVGILFVALFIRIYKLILNWMYLILISVRYKIVSKFFSNLYILFQSVFQDYQDFYLIFYLLGYKSERNVILLSYL